MKQLIGWIGANFEHRNHRQNWLEPMNGNLGTRLMLYSRVTKFIKEGKGLVHKFFRGLWQSLWFNKISNISDLFGSFVKNAYFSLCHVSINLSAIFLPSARLSFRAAGFFAAAFSKSLSYSQFRASLGSRWNVCFLCISWFKSSRLDYRRSAFQNIQRFNAYCTTTKSNNPLSICGFTTHTLSKCMVVFWEL